MKTSIKYIIKPYIVFRFIRFKLKKREFKIDKRVFIFTFFLFVSTLFWFLTALNKEYVTEITYPVTYYNFPSDRVLTNQPPNHLNLKVHSFGFTILQHKMKIGQWPILINLRANELINKHKKDSTHYFLLSNSVIKRISNQFSSDIRILEVEPDSLHFVFDKIVHKRLAVKNNMKISMTKQYVQNGKIIISPDSITVSGPRTIIDTMQHVYTEFVDFKDVNNSIIHQIPILSNEKLAFSHNEVIVNIPVERYTEAQFSIPIQVKNLPRAMDMKMFPSTVNVSCLVVMSQFESITENQFTAVVDYHSIENKRTKQIRVKIIEAPNNIISYSFFPRSIDYFIEKY